MLLMVLTLLALGVPEHLLVHVLLEHHLLHEQGGAEDNLMNGFSRGPMLRGLDRRRTSAT